MGVEPRLEEPVPPVLPRAPDAAVTPERVDGLPVAPELGEDLAAVDTARRAADAGRGAEGAIALAGLPGQDSPGHAKAGMVIVGQRPRERLGSRDVADGGKRRGLPREPGVPGEGIRSAVHGSRSPPNGGRCLAER